jgi:hypothetical protein
MHMARRGNYPISEEAREGLDWVSRHTGMKKYALVDRELRAMRDRFVAGLTPEELERARDKLEGQSK